MLSGEFNGNQISATSRHISVSVSEDCFDNSPNIFKQGSWYSSTMADSAEEYVLLVQ